MPFIPQLVMGLPGKATITEASEPVIPENTQRQILRIRNFGLNTIYYRFGAASTVDCYPLRPLEEHVYTAPCPGAAVNAVCAASEVSEVRWMENT